MFLTRSTTGPSPCCWSITSLATLAVFSYDADCTAAREALSAWAGCFKLNNQRTVPIKIELQFGITSARIDIYNYNGSLRQSRACDPDDLQVGATFDRRSRLSGFEHSVRCRVATKASKPLRAIIFCLWYFLSFHFNIKICVKTSLFAHHLHLTVTAMVPPLFSVAT